VPLPNEHACRLRDPSDFKPESFRRMVREHAGKAYSVIMGRLRGQDTLTEQTYRYDKSTWTADAARSHCKAHKGRFEAARVEKENERQVLKTVVRKLKDAFYTVMKQVDAVGQVEVAQDIWFGCFSKADKAALSMFETVPSGEGLRYSIQRCYVGKTVYDILNLDTGAGGVLRWALLSAAKDDAKVVTTLKEALSCSADVDLDSITCAPLEARSKVWMHLHGVQPVGKSGASADFPGVYRLIDEGDLEYGEQTPYSHEYILSKGKQEGRFMVLLTKSVAEGEQAGGELMLTPALWTLSKVVEPKVVHKSGPRSELIFKSVGEEPEYIVGGIVYPADAVDLQGDTVSKEDIWKLLKHFMLNGRQFSVQHHGRKVALPIIESFQAEVDTIKGGAPLPAGAFWLAVSLANERSLFTDIKNGVITGWSIEGTGMAEQLKG